MATVKLPKHKTNIPVYVDKTLRNELRTLAKEQGIKVTDFCRRILIYAAKHHAKIEEGRVIFATGDSALALSETKTSPPPAPPLDPHKGPVNYRRK